MRLARWSPSAQKMNRHAGSESPRLFVFAKSGSPASGMGARATSHTLQALASVCGEGELPRGVHATAYGGAPLRLHRNNSPVSDAGA
jgi:hypothetical protein